MTPQPLVRRTLSEVSADRDADRDARRRSIYLGGLPRVEVVDGDLDKALRQIRSSMQESAGELHRRSSFVRPAQKRRVKAMRARKRQAQAGRRRLWWER